MRNVMNYYAIFINSIFTSILEVAQNARCSLFFHASLTGKLNNIYLAKLHVTFKFMDLVHPFMIKAATTFHRENELLKGSRRNPRATAVLVTFSANNHSRNCYSSLKYLFVII